MDDRLRMLFGISIGAAAMYYLDPSRGRQRRALVRNQMVHAAHRAQHGMGVVGRDFWNRAVGVSAQARSMFDTTTPDDDVLVERVRACLGRVVTHPSSVRVDARDGVVTLSGLILESEVPALLACARGVHGVTEVRNELEAHAEPGRIPGLQGQPPPLRANHRLAFMQSNWPPAARVAGGLAGAVATLYGIRERGARGTAVGAAGALLLTRAATNLEMRRLFGIGTPRHAVDIHKSIRIAAPIEQVFELWEDFEHFPRLMKHVRRVRRISTGETHPRWRWTVHCGGPIELEFDAVITAREENRLIAWRTEGSALVQHSGITHFRGNEDGSTTVDVKMTYNPVIGALGHSVAWLLGMDPKRQMDDDLLRVKTYLETGRPPRDAAERGAEPREPMTQQEMWRHEAPPREAGMPGVR